MYGDMGALGPPRRSDFVGVLNPLPVSIHPRELYGKNRWSEYLDEKVKREVKKRIPSYKLSLDEFVDCLFGISPSTMRLMTALPEEDMFERVYKYYKELNENRPLPPPSRPTRHFRKGIKGRVRSDGSSTSGNPAQPTGLGQGGPGDQSLAALAKERELLALKLRCKLKVNARELIDSLDPPNDSEPEIVPDTPLPPPEPVRAKLTKGDKLVAIWKWLKGGSSKPRRSRRIAPCPVTDPPSPDGQWRLNS